MSKKIDVRYAIESTDLTDVSTVRKYPLGLEISIEDQENKATNTFIYLQQAFLNATAYRPQDVFAGFTTLSNVTSGTTVRPVVPQQDVPNGSYAFYQAGGVSTVFVEEVHAENIVVGSKLKVVAGGLLGLRNTTGNANEGSVCAAAMESILPGADGNIKVRLYNRYALTA